MSDAEGNATGHLIGLFHRTVQFIEAGVKPIWIFDGKPPDMKDSEINKRRSHKKEAAEDCKEAIEDGDFDKARQLSARTIRVSKQMKEDAKRLI